jgi:hypothetical protein
MSKHETIARNTEWSIFALLAAMVVVMTVVAFSLHRNSPLVATAPTLAVSEPETTGQGDLTPARGRSGIER